MVVDKRPPATKVKVLNRNRTVGRNGKLSLKITSDEPSVVALVGTVKPGAQVARARQEPLAQDDQDPEGRPGLPHCGRAEADHPVLKPCAAQHPAQLQLDDEAVARGGRRRAQPGDAQDDPRRQALSRRARRAASAMIVICGFTPSDAGTTLPSAT